MYKEENPHSWRLQSNIAFSLEVVSGLSVLWVTWERPDQFRPRLTPFCLTKGSSGSPGDGKSVMVFPGMLSQNPMASGQRLSWSVVTLCILSPSKDFTFPVAVHQFLCTAALPGLRARSLLALHVLLMDGCVHLCHVPLTLPCLFQGERS